VHQQHEHDAAVGGHQEGESTHHWQDVQGGKEVNGHGCQVYTVVNRS